MTRKAARERTLELLYEAEAKQVTPADVIAGLPLPPETYTADVVAGVGQHLADLDEVITRYAAPEWPLDRMPVVDRTLLRIGVYELAHRPDIPTAVAISEAVELAKRFSTEDSGRFVNGVLSRIADELRPDR